MSKPKRIPVALLKAAYKKAVEAYTKAGGFLPVSSWDENNEASRSALRAFARYILKHQPK